MSKINRYALYILMSIFILTMFTACGGMGGDVTVDKNVRLSQRLQSYIAARKQANLGQLQQLHLKPEQARLGSIIVKDCKIASVVISDDSLHAVTKLENKIQAMGFSFEKVPTTINWIWSNNDWYIAPSANSGNPFARKKSNSSAESTKKGQNEK